MDYYLSNLSLLQEREPNLCQQLTEVPPKISFPSGPSDLSCLIPPNLDLSTLDIVVCLGFASGEELIALEKLLPARIFFLIIEYDLGHLKAALEARDFSPLFTSRRVSLAVGEEPFAATRIRLDNYYHIVTFASMHIIEYKPSIDLAPAYYQEIKDWLKEAAKVSQRNIATLSDSAPLWQHNILENLPIVARSPGVDTLFERFRDIPAIIVAAGPSLDKNVRELEKAKGKALITAVDTALRTLYLNGIEPDIVVSIDANPANYKDFKGVSLKEADLLTEPVAYPEILSSFPQRVFISSYGHPLMNWIEESIDPKGYLKVGGSVATTCFDLLRKMGANPIIFVGQDLAYTGGASHTKGFFGYDDAVDNGALSKFCTLEMLYRQACRERGEVELVEGIDGEMVLTSPMMKGWLSWLESQVDEVKREGINCIDATEGGAKIRGTQILTLRETIDTYCKNPHDIRERLNTACANYQPPPLDKLINELDKLICEYRWAKDEIAEGEKLSRRLLWLLKDETSQEKLDRTFQRVRNLYQSVTSKPRFMKVSRWNMEPLFFEMKKGKKDDTPQTIAELYHNFFEGALRLVTEGYHEFSKCKKILEEGLNPTDVAVGG